MYRKEVKSIAKEAARYHDRITEDPRIMAGKPVVKGTRIPVDKVLDQLAYNSELDELFAIYPELTRDDVKACLAYAQAVVTKERRHALRSPAGSTAGE